METRQNTGKNRDTRGIRTLVGGATDLANSSAASNNDGGGAPGYPNDGTWIVRAQT